MLAYCVLDIENNNSGKYGRKAGNFLYDKIVAIGWKRFDEKESDSEISPLYDCLESQILFEDINILIGHNIKHDLLFLWKNIELQDWLLKGGKIWDTQLAEYILSGQTEKYTALRELAVNKYRCEKREKLMESYWEKGFDTDEIPIEFVIEDVENDVKDTEQIFLSQYQKAKQLGQLKLIELEMDSLLATIEMEYNGFFIEIEKLRENKINLEIELEKEKTECLSLLNKYD